MSACAKIAVVPSSQDNSARMGTVTPFPPDDPQAGSGATSLVVVDGAILECDHGSAPSTLKVTSGTQGSADNKLVAVTKDHAAGTNIFPFGT